MGHGAMLEDDSEAGLAGRLLEKDSGVMQEAAVSSVEQRAMQPAWSGSPGSVS